MGCDIHAIIQVKENDTWVTKEAPNLGRNYVLFSVLANVRNGFGFAGVRTYDPLPFIAEPRGLPDDLELVAQDDNIDSDDNSLEKDSVEIFHRSYSSFCKYQWMGDHSHSWLLFSEINAYDWKKEFQFEGMVDQKTNENTPEGAEPDNYCAWTSSNDYVKRFWKRTISQKVGIEFMWLIEAYSNYYGAENCRLVFGFDS